jgi:hypothetical protein
MPKSAIDFYHELLHDSPTIVSLAGLAAMSAAYDEFHESGDDPALSVFMARVDENLDALVDYLDTLRPGEPSDE